GAVIADSATPVFLFCHFERNRALNAGAINALGSGVLLLGSTLVGNIATQANGNGALVVTGNPWQGNPFLVASTAFVGNEGGFGGAVAAYGVGPGDGRVVNVTFAGNRAPSGGRAVYARDPRGLRLEHAVLLGDEAAGPPAPGALQL